MLEKIKYLLVVNKKNKEFNGFLLNSFCFCEILQNKAWCCLSVKVQGRKFFF